MMLKSNWYFTLRNERLDTSLITLTERTLRGLFEGKNLIAIEHIVLALGLSPLRATLVVLLDQLPPNLLILAHGRLMVSSLMNCVAGIEHDFFDTLP
jgi:hypothetical protein